MTGWAYVQVAPGSSRPRSHGSPGRLSTPSSSGLCCRHAAPVRLSASPPGHQHLADPGHVLSCKPGARHADAVAGPDRGLPLHIIADVLNAGRFGAPGVERHRGIRDQRRRGVVFRDHGRADADIGPVRSQGAASLPRGQRQQDQPGVVSGRLRLRAGGPGRGEPRRQPLARCHRLASPGAGPQTAPGRPPRFRLRP